MMRRVSPCSALYSAALLAFLAQTLPAQQEVVRPGETYDSLQAGLDAYGDAEAQRRAMIGRQLMIQEEILANNTWADPKYKYQPAGPESFGPILPKAYIGATLADVYAYPPTGGGVTYYGSPGAVVPGGTVITSCPAPGYAAPVPVFQPWPRVPNDIWGAPYYGYVRQPIGHVKIWTGRLSYIYKPVYASPPMAPEAQSPLPEPAAGQSDEKASDAPASVDPRRTPPPPPQPYLPHRVGREL